MAKAKAENKVPKFHAGEAYYLSHKTGAPARIYIDMVYMRPRSTEWMYAIYSEANPDGNITFASESILTQRISKHDNPIYKNDVVIQRYDDGYRFAGNYSMEEAIARGETFARNGHIKSVMLHPALDYKGDTIDGQYGIWIKWDCIIADGGLNNPSTIKIK